MSRRCALLVQVHGRETQVQLLDLHPLGPDEQGVQPLVLPEVERLLLQQPVPLFILGAFFFHLFVIITLSSELLLMPVNGTFHLVSADKGQGRQAAATEI